MPPCIPRSKMLVLNCLLVSAIVSACSDSTTPPKPAALSATTSTASTGTVGAAVPIAPAVKVTDANGAPVRDVAVQFAVTMGGGSLGSSTATTDVTGTASAGSWTLGTVAGPNEVTATVSGMAALRFTATGKPAAPATVAISAGDAQAADVGVAVPTVPAVIVKDQYANAVPAIDVTFSVLSGNGTVSGAVATTGADGIARPADWTLGIVTGAQQLRASVGSLSATFSATASLPAGCKVTNYALGATLPLAFDANDCVNAGFGARRFDRLQFTTTTQQQVDATVAAPNGPALLLRNATSGLYVGLQPSAAFSPPTQNPMHLKYVLAPGSYVFEPHAPDATTTGAYTLSTTTGTKVDCDYVVFASTNVQFSDDLNARSCASPFGGVEQWINLQLKTGTKVRITLSNSEFVPILVFRDDRLGPASPTLVSKVGNVAGQTLTIDWTATFDTWHEIVVAPKTATLGKYTLKIEELP